MRQRTSFRRIVAKALPIPELAPVTMALGMLQLDRGVDRESWKETDHRIRTQSREQLM